METQGVVYKVKILFYQINGKKTRLTLESEIDVASGKFDKKNKRSPL